MNLEITKAFFDNAVPAAREPKGKIYESLIDAINAHVDEIGFGMLGEPGTDMAENGDGFQADRLRDTVKRMACVDVFVGHMRSLDLVLTATGFGVVSTQDTAPASKMRVDALEGELRKKRLVLHSQLLQQLFKVEGWSNTEQRRQHVPTLFWSFMMLQHYAGISDPKPEDWYNNVPTILLAHQKLCMHISKEYMEELLSQLTSGTVTDCNRIVIQDCQTYIGACISQNLRLQSETYMSLINTLEDNLEDYPAYARSEAYKLNHFKPYENHAEDSAFHFVG